MLSQNIALVPEAGGVSPAELLRVSAALQRQVGSHFGPVWEVHATVDPFMELEEVPAGYVPIVLSPLRSSDRAVEILVDQNGQPYARVSLAANWSLNASRACLELLVNPYGQRTLSAPSPRSDQGPAELLVEVCGAFGDMPTAYAVNDVAVSDFCTPAFFRASSLRVGEGYSFRGSLSAPLQLLRGGHLTWFDAISNSWWLRSFHDENPADQSLGTVQVRGRSLCELIAKHEPRRTGTALFHEPLDTRIRWQWLREQASAASLARAQRLRLSFSGEEPDEEETVLYTPGTALMERPNKRRSNPPPLPGTGLMNSERALGSVRERELEAQPAKPEVLGSVVTTLDPPESTAPGERNESGMVARRDTLPFARLLPGPNAASSRSAEVTLEAREPSQEPAPSQAVVAGNRAVETRGSRRAQDGAPSNPRSQSTMKPAAASSSTTHSSIAPIAMLAEPARGDGSRTGFMIAGVAVAGLVLVGLMSGGTRSAAHGSPSGHAAATPVVALKPDAATQAVAEAPKVAATATDAKPAEPVPAVPPRAKPERASSEQRSERLEAHGSAREQNEDARAKRRHKDRAESESVPTPSEAPAGLGQRTAAIENMFDTRR